MVDFLYISSRVKKKGLREIYPKFIIKNPSEDLMIRGKDFYAVWIEERGLWSTNEQDLIDLVDRELDRFAKDHENAYEGETVVVAHMWDSESGSIDAWHKFCQKQMRDSYQQLDEKLIFSDTEVSKKDFASKRLPYPLQSGECPAWEKFTTVLYSPEERKKIEWAIGAVISGDSKEIQKFMVFYGDPGTGKSTILDIIQLLFDGYYCVFDAKALGNPNSVFALEPFKTNPLVAIQQDGDLSRIEDNTRLNSIASHDEMTVNEKFKALYSTRFKCFMFMGTNKPVRITDAKSGIIRRLIDVSPTGNKIPRKEYDRLKAQVRFELGPIAKRCLDQYLEDPSAYDNYIPVGMLGASNDFYNYVLDSYSVFEREDGISQKAAWEMYRTYCEEARVPYPLSLRVFKEELKNYFKDFVDRKSLEDGTRVWNWYSGFRKDKFSRDMFTEKPREKSKKKESEYWFNPIEQTSLFDILAADYPAQYTTDEGTPRRKWSNVTTQLKDLNTSELHYVKLPVNHIVIDFDIPDENGNKCLEKNLEAVSRWPPTYGELSKSGQGIHLHYIYKGDPTKLSSIYDDRIEIKVFDGNKALRRKLTKCNDLQIAELSSGLPLKGEDKLVNTETVKNEKAIRTLIKRNLCKEYHPGTKPSVDFIKKILDDAYESGVHYDVSDMFNAVLAFATKSTHHAEYCVTLVTEMHFKSADASTEGFPADEDLNIGSGETADILVFFDVEVFPNLFVVCWKAAGEDQQVIRMINPTPKDIESLMRYKLIGFNCRQYDNHICYARMLGYTNEQLYSLSQSIISSEKGSRNRGMFGNAYNFSYTDILDFSSEKKSLKKFEIELGIHHQELGLEWDQPVPEEMWDKVAEYCANDVIATEAVWNARQADFMARQIQVELVKALHGINTVTVNDTTNSLSEKIIFGTDKNPQIQFNYRDLSKPVSWTEYSVYRQKFGEDYIFRIFDENGLPTYEVYDGDGMTVLPDGYSILPFFPGYKYEFGKSTYMGEEIGEGGRVYAEPGIHEDVWDGDIASQHPHSVIAECLFGPKYTKIFEQIVEARVAIKHKDFEKAGTMLNGVLKPWLTDEYAAGLAQALKIVINSIYGLTSAAFTNRFRDERNVDNIVAKRGALFMTLLKSEVQKRGFTVAHIKTDSIKIEHATADIREFVVKFGHEFGYDFETEAEFDKFCLVNDAVYVAKYKEEQKDGWWTATGTQFQVPYVFKSLFSGKEPVFNDFCETKSVAKGAIVIDMNEALPQLTEEEEKLKKKYESGKLPEDDFFKELVQKEKDSHNYIFVGRVGQFTPIVSGGGGGILYRKAEGKYYALPGTKGYRWLESEMVRNLDKADQIDQTYYEELAREAVKTINEIGNKCGWGGYLKLVGKEETPDDNFEWPPETPKY